MPITLDEPGAARHPVLKARTIGDRFTGCVVKFENRDRQDKDGNPVRKSDGKISQELVVTLRTTASTMGVGKVEDLTIPQQGDIVRLILKGAAFGEWIEAKNALGRGVQVGDVLDYTLTHAVSYDHNGKKIGETTDQAVVDNKRMAGGTVGVYGTLNLRAATSAEQPLVDAAEAAYYELQSAPAQSQGIGAGDPYEGEEPF